MRERTGLDLGGMLSGHCLVWGKKKKKKRKIEKKGGERGGCKGLKLS